jgi:hypothetical protein
MPEMKHLHLKITKTLYNNLKLQALQNGYDRYQDYAIVLLTSQISEDSK